MTRAELLHRLDELENHDPRCDPCNPGCAVWIWERDQVLAELHNLEHEAKPSPGPRPPLGPLSKQAMEWMLFN